MDEQKVGIDWELFYANGLLVYMVAIAVICAYFVLSFFLRGG